MVTERTSEISKTPTGLIIDRLLCHWKDRELTLITLLQLFFSTCDAMEPTFHRQARSGLMLPYTVAI